MRKIKGSGVSTPQLAFNNETLSTDVISRRSSLGYTLKNLDILNGAVDAKINNYSALILSDKKDIEKTLSVKTPNTVSILVENTDPNKYVFLSTPLKFQTTIDGEYATAYLAALNSDGGIFVSFSNKEGVNTQFGVEFRNSREASVFITKGGVRLYLNAENNKFTETYYRFSPFWNSVSGKLVLVKPGTQGDYIVAPALTASTLNTAASLSTLNVTNTAGAYASAGIIDVIPLKNEFVPDISNKWNEFEKTYEKTTKKISVESLSGIETSYLVNMEYDTISDNKLVFNVLQTKDVLDRTNIQGKTSYLLKGEENDAVDFRQYTGLFMGAEEEKGFSAPILSYIGMSGVINVQAGTVLEFTTPARNIDSADSEIGIFKVLNINDTTFIESGAIAGEAPILSDKVYKKRDNYVSPITDDATGVYLCTWLYSPPNGAAPVWLDRYYNPVRQAGLDPAFEGISNETTYVQEQSQHNVYQEALRNKGFFDKKSDLFLEGGATYQYYRIDENLFKSYLNNLYGENLLDSLDVVPAGYVSNTKALFNPIDKFTLNISVNRNNWASRSAHTILSNKSGEGFAIYNDVHSSTHIVINEGRELSILNTVLDEFYTIRADNVTGEFGRSFTYVYHHGIGDYMFVVMDNGLCAKVSFDGEVRESVKIAPISNIRGHHFDYNANKLHLFDGNNMHTFDWFDVSYESTASSVCKKIDISGGSLVSYSDRITIDDILLQDVSLIGATIIDVSVDKNNNFCILYRVSGDTTNGYISIFNQSKQLIKTISSNLYYAGRNLETIATHDGSFVVVTAGSSIFKLNYSGNLISQKTFEHTLGYSSLSGTSGIRNYFGNILDTDIIVDFRYNYNSSENSVCLYDKYVVPGKGFSPGTHDFSFVFDAVLGKATLFVNGYSYKSTIFTADIFRLKNGFKNEFILGGPMYSLGNRLWTYLSDYSDFLALSEGSLKFYRLYNAAFTHGDIFAHLRGKSIVPDIHLQIPFRLKPEMEEIKTVYRMGLPGRKDNTIGIKINGLEGVNNLSLLMANINSALNNENPVSTVFNL